MQFSRSLVWAHSLQSVSRHPEAYKVRIFGAAVAGAFVVALLVGGVARLMHHRP
jgi:hypothetical protein